MALEADFVVRGIPKAQPRPRAAVVNGHARVYESGTAEAWKGDVIRDGRPHRPTEPWTHALSLSIAFWLPRPKRLMRKCDPDGVFYCDAKPDADNLAKAVMDALLADGWFRDDAQVVDLTVRKLYHAKQGCPGARIILGTAGLFWETETPAELTA